DRARAGLGGAGRRGILRRLKDAPGRAGELGAGFGISRPAVCKHTRWLARAGLIRATKSGRERIYQLAPTGRKAMREAIEELRDMERYWDFILEAFKNYAEKRR